jgi:hypothetical protein
MRASTIDRLNAMRCIKPTVFSPNWLSEYTNIKYIPKNGVGTNKNVSADLFDEIVKEKIVEGVIHAKGYIGKVPTFLILSK